MGLWGLALCGDAAPLSSASSLALPEGASCAIGWIACPQRRRRAEALSRTLCAELSPLLWGPESLGPWQLDATHSPQLVGVSGDAFGAGVRGGGLCRATPRLAARARGRRARGSLGPPAAAHRDANPCHAPSLGFGLA